MQLNRHYSQLDGLRAFAVAGVMVSHWIVWDTRNKFITSIPWNHGVILFFVLSGYLITQILLFQRENIETAKVSMRASLRTFYARRFLRIFPIYYLMLFFLLYINFDNTRGYFPWLVTYTSNFVMAIRGELIGSFTHLWSLAIEEQFYLAWPLLIFLVPRHRILHLIIGGIVVSFLSRLICAILYKEGYTNWMWGAYFTPNLMLPLLLGALLAFIRFDPKFKSLHNKLSGIWLLYGAIVFYAVAYYLCIVKYKVPYFHELLDEYLFAFACFFIILRASENKFRFIGKYILEHDIVTFTGKISYGLYLYHMFVIGLFWNFISPKLGVHIDNKYTAWVVYFIICFVIGTISYFLVEKPMNGLKKHFKY